MKRLFKKVVQGRFRKPDKAGVAGCVIENTQAAAESSSQIFNSEFSLINENDDPNNVHIFDISEDQLQNLEYEEITFYRPAKTAKLGLTLWYENDCDQETNIFVSKIEYGSLVDVDGRIRIGDQILQICGLDVHSKNQAVELLTHCNKIVKFLVVRPRNLSLTTPMSPVCSPHQDLIRREYRTNVEANKIREEETLSSDGAITQISAGKDSGISRLTDDSDPEPSWRRFGAGGALMLTTNQNNANCSTGGAAGPKLQQQNQQQCQQNQQQNQQNQQLQQQGQPKIKHLSVGNFVGYDEYDEMSHSPRANSRLGGKQQWPARFASENSFFDTDHYNSDRSGCEQTIIGNQEKVKIERCNVKQILLEQDLRYLHNEMANIQLECDRLIASKATTIAAPPLHTLMATPSGSVGRGMSRIQQRAPIARPERTSSIQSSSSATTKVETSTNTTTTTTKAALNSTSVGATGSGSSGSAEKNNKSGPHPEEPATTSSAYNTGNDSSRSTPQTPQTTTTIKVDNQKIVNQMDRPTVIYHQIADNSCLEITQSAPNVSRIRSTSVTVSERKGPVNKVSSSTTTTIHTNPATVINTAHPHQQQQPHHQKSGSSGGDFFADPNLHKNAPSVSVGGIQSASASQPSVFRPDRRQLPPLPTHVVGEVLRVEPENLQKTVLLQQRLLRQAMIRQAYRLKAQQEQREQASRLMQDSPYGRFEPVPATKHHRSMSFQHKSTPHGFPAKLEWKLKKRSDGTRYIARRLVRNKILKDRAQQLNSMRTGISSTDDDAHSELKTGRYWTREERKRHFERSRERKRRQEELFHRKMQILTLTSEQPVLRLSQKKQQRRQGYELLDNFTTIQEFLSRDTRTLTDKKPMGLLTVTTV